MDWKVLVQASIFAFASSIIIFPFFLWGYDALIYPAGDWALAHHSCATTGEIHSTYCYKGMRVEEVTFTDSVGGCLNWENGSRKILIAKGDLLAQMTLAHEYQHQVNYLSGVKDRVLDEELARAAELNLTLLTTPTTQCA